MDCKIVWTVDFSIVNLWIVLDGVFDCYSSASEGDNPPARLERRLHVCIFIYLFFWFFSFLHLLSLLSFLYLCARASKAYSYPLPTVLCNKNPSWLSTSGTHQKWAIYVTGCLFDFRSATQLLFCNFLLNDVDDGNYDDNENFK